MGSPQRRKSKISGDRLGANHQHRLKVRRLVFLINNRGLHFLEAGALQQSTPVRLR